MASHGESKSLKRSEASKLLRAPRKLFKYISKPLPGPHRKSESITLLSFLRDVLRIAENAREVKYLLNTHVVKVNGKIMKEPKANIGFSDIVEINKDIYLVWLDSFGKFIAKKIDFPLKFEKIVRIDKYKGGFNVYRMHDGFNLVDKLNSINAKVNDTLVINKADKKIQKIIPFSVGKKVIVFRGKKLGIQGELISVGKECKIKTENEIINALSENCLVYE
ncbi:MAG: hypothetical protein QW061_01075 [Candidatus Rehaiarchaeum fermentans]|nr:hypothetical protein [Candidatus Rehaiarchaeum fermentans]